MRAARVCVLLFLSLLALLLLSTLADAQEPRLLRAADAYGDRPAYVRRADYDSRPPAPREYSSISRQLESLERAVFDSGERDSKKLLQYGSEANEIWRQATTTDDRLRARDLVNHIDRIVTANIPVPADSAAYSAPLSGATSGRPLDGLVALTQFVAPITAGAGLPIYSAGAAPPTGTTPLLAMGPGCATPPPPPPIVPVTPPVLPRHYVSFDALGWFMQKDQLPALVTTSPIGTPQTTAGVLGLPTTSVLFGDSGVNGGMRPGGRVQGGAWLDAWQTFAIEANYYALATKTATFSANSTFSDGSLNDQILARPYFNIAPGINQQASVITAFPDFVIPPFVLPPNVVDVDGSINVQESSSIQSAGGGGRMALTPFNSRVRLSASGAYRYFSLIEDFSIVATSTPGTDPFPFPIPQGEIQSFDRFDTKNIFNGGEIGLAAELPLRRFSISADTRLALGQMYQRLVVDGRTSAISGGYVASYPGGLLAQPTNIGVYSRNRFALIPQVDVKLGYQVFPALRITVGYNFTYITNVLRPGNQIDTTVNTTQIAGLPLIGEARPQATLNESGVWLQGVTTGFDLRF